MPTPSHQLQLICLIQSSQLNCNSGTRINLDEDSSGLCWWNTDTLWFRWLCAWLASFRSCKNAESSSWQRFSCPGAALFRSASVSPSLSFCLCPFRPLACHFSSLFRFPFFMCQVSECNWPSRQAPSLHNLFAVCKNMHNWLKQNPKNVCVITCSVRKHSYCLLITFCRLLPLSVTVNWCWFYNIQISNSVIPLLTI